MIENTSTPQNQLPLLALKDVVLLPKSIVPIIVGRSISLHAIEHALKNNKEIIVTAQKDAAIEQPGLSDLYTYGTRATVLQAIRMPKGTVKLLIEGICRVKLTAINQQDGFYYADYKDLIPEFEKNKLKIHALWRHLLSLYKKYMQLNPKVPTDIASSVRTIDDISVAADTIALHISLTIAGRQEILELVDLKERLFKLCVHLQNELDIIETEERIKGHVQTQIEKGQREYYLNEQIKAIHKELGHDNQQAEIDELRARAEDALMPDQAFEKVDAELRRLEQMSPFSAEAVVCRNYVEWLVALPWGTYSRDSISLKQAEKILDRDHAGLKKAKERIIEFVAAKKFNPDLKRTPTICLVGPPGVGKTSLGKSIAQSLGRTFVRISLGGTRDEAEIRGHRRTYIGALPGKIIQALRRSKTNNPVILLDEIDKMSCNTQGDPASALLEVLDPEQNNTFVDNFLEVDYDLSQVMFLTTANHPENIPYPLYDRMEIISLSGYTNQEKLEIAKKFLLPKHLKENNVAKGQLSLTPSVLAFIIEHYTKEAGVRQLERLIMKLIRKSIQEFLKDPDLISISITKATCLEWLGAPPFKKKQHDATQMPIGCATGLAWTELGGDILEIETTIIPGKGELTLTGQLGDVMRESAQAALSYVRSRSTKLGIKKTFYPAHDIHVHVPEGATPKDGPSAGITICTALVSALTNNPIKPAIAMTGEITLRGRVLPVGGLKEKLLAAQQHGIKTILVPADNKDDIEKFKHELDKKLEIYFVATMDEVMQHALSQKAA